MQNKILRKGLVLGIIVMFVGMASTPGINAINIVRNNGLQEIVDSYVIGKNKVLLEKNNFQTSLKNIDSDVISMINTINYSLLFGYLQKIVSFGTRFVGSENCRRAAEYINEEFQRLGLYSYIDKWKYPFFKSHNIIGTYKGTDPTSDAVFVLTAHLDTAKHTVGANDDGSGVAALLTIANIISKYQFNHTIKFVIVSGEEVGLWGSFDYAKKAYQNNENIIANLNVDSIGNTTVGNIIGAYTPDRSIWLYSYTNEVNQRYEKYIDLKVQSCPNGPTDSQSFVDYGFDAISFTQSNFIDYPFHTPEDTLEKIVYPYFENVTKLVLALTAEVANRKIELQVRITAPKEGFIYLFDLPIVKLPGFNIVFTPVRGMTYLIGRSIAKIDISTEEDIILVIYNFDGNIDHNFMKTKPPYKWRLKKPFYYMGFRLRGKHTFGVHVFTSTGKAAYDEMNFYALTPI
jgi:hypothetical protein